MGGKSKKTVIGYWYKWLAHFLFSQRVDAVLELRAGGKTMWAGRVTENQRISVNKPDLFGGIKNAGGQGGVVTDIDLQFGRVRLQPRHCRLRVIARCRPGKLRREPVLDRRHRETAGRQVAVEPGELGFPSAVPTAAVNQEHARRTSRVIGEARRRRVEIQIHPVRRVDMGGDGS